MISWIQSQFTSLVSMIVMLLCFGVAVVAGIRFGGGNKVLAWIIGITVLVVMVVLTGPVIESLDSRSCALNVDKCR